MITVKGGNEWVRRAVCSSCGATGPMASSEDASKALAILCGWNQRTGKCKLCNDMLREKSKSKKK